MKQLCACGLYQKKSPSPIYQSISSRETRIESPNIDMAALNDDQNGWYTVDVGETQFTLPVRYQNPTPVGRGAFGAVICVDDKELGKPVAIKRMLHPFQTKTHAKRTYRELKLLMYLNHPDAQVIQLYNVFTPDVSVAEFQTLSFVFNFVDYDLHRVIKRRLPFSEDHIRQIIYSLLRGLKFMHSGGILHRDLKPANIGVDKDSNVTILDFGLARAASDGLHTGYVATRWWRAPEVYINWERYDEKLDIWSVGCIMAELILLRPIFPGNDHTDQLNRMFDIIGTPDLATLNQICTTDARRFIIGVPPRPKRDYNDLFGFKYGPGSTAPISGVSPKGIDFLDRLLSFDHRKRPTAEEALAHPFLESLRDLREEPTIGPVIDEHQDAVYTIAQWKSIIWQMIQEFVPPPFVSNNGDDDL